MRLYAYLLAAVLLAAPALAEDRKGDVWPLKTCVVSGEEMGGMGEPVVKVYDGREVRFCCAGCVKTFEKNKEALLQKADATIIAEQKAAYPLETCLNSGEPLGKAPVEGVIGNRLVRTCCNDCMDTLKNDPAAAVKKLDAAVIAKQKPGYKGTVCPVSGHKIEGDGVDAVVAGTYVKLCCKDCVAGLDKDPLGVIAKAMAPAKP